MRQVEVSRTLVFDDPRRARGFFEALVADNIGIGRPEQVALVFARPLRRPTRHELADARVRDRHRGPDRLPLQALPRQAVPQGRPRAADRDRHQQARRPRRPAPASSTCPNWSPRPAPSTGGLLMIERAGQSCAIGSALFERIHQPYTPRGPTNRSPALRRLTRHGSGRRPLPSPPRRHRLHQQKPSRARRRTPRPRLQRQPDELRPAPPAPPRPHPTPAPQQHLRHSRPTDPRRRLLPQAPKPLYSRPLLDADKPPAQIEIAAHSRRSNAPSTNTSTAHASPPAA